MANHDRNFGANLPIDTDRAGDWPTDSDEFKDDISQRLTLDHFMDNVLTEGAANQDGRHRQVTLKERTKPTEIADAGIVYTKDVSGVTELFFVDSAGNEVQLTDEGKLNSTSFENIVAESVSADSIDCYKHSDDASIVINTTGFFYVYKTITLLVSYTGNTSKNSDYLRINPVIDGEITYVTKTFGSMWCYMSYDKINMKGIATLAPGVYYITHEGGSFSMQIVGFQGKNSMTDLSNVIVKV